ncbi:proteophosphoglycan 5 [Gigaspora margarita]|uniref:GDP-fucose protein O-fucosyltransferase 2 n=1 Tax=Gigaspora margarita TaxID=4874 RepID=A0A8H3XCJ1_GIGMA|nr:proteophosphoglycan 5 [Gigaspora margarita]
MLHIYNCFIRYIIHYINYIRKKRIRSIILFIFIALVFTFLTFWNYENVEKLLDLNKENNRLIIKEETDPKVIYKLFSKLNNDKKNLYNIPKDLNNDYSKVDYDTKINQKFCGSNTCKFLFFYRSPEQETRANFHFKTMIELAEKLNRTMVLTNVGQSRIGSCQQFPYNFYYNVDLFQEHAPNVKFMSQADFQQWTHERRNKPDTSHIYIDTVKKNPNTFEFVEPFIERLITQECLNKFQLKMDDNMIFKSVNIGPKKLWETNKIANSNMTSYLISQLNTSTEVILINHDLRSHLFLNRKEILLPYANHLIKAANKVANELNPYIGIHWRMERTVTKSLIRCANKLVKWIDSTKKTTNITNVYFATDYPIDYMGKAQSATFHEITKEHHEAVKVLNSSMHLDTWKSTNSLEYIDKFPELNEMLQKEFRGAGVQGIIDKLILVLSDYFVTGPEGCCRARSSFTGRIVRARTEMMKAGNPNIKNIMSHW